MAFSYEEAIAFALTLPHTSTQSFYGDMVPKVNKKAFVSPGREPGSFHLFCGSVDRAEMLKEIEPDTYWQSAHYIGWPGILVREANADPDHVRHLIEEGWALRATAKQRAERDAAG